MSSLQQVFSRLVITSILNVAKETWRDAGGRGSGQPLFGATLGDAIVLVVERLSGNVEGAVANPAVVATFFQRLVALALAHPSRFGSRGLLRIVDALIEDVLATGALPDDAAILEALS